MDLRPTCTLCKCAMDVTNIRANPSGSGFVCRTCLEIKQGSLNAPLARLEERQDIFAKKSYFCEDCGYSFERNATFVVSTCPMCASQDVNEMMIDDYEVTVDHENDEIIFQ